MPAIDPADLALLRTHPHKIKEYLAVIHPPTMLACQLDGAPSGDPATQITYDNVAEGAFGDVVAGMTLWVGSTAGGRDKGSCRIRKAPTESILYIAEDSAVDWEDDDYLTVVENYELWSKYPRIVVDGDDITFYKDWDVAYSDQHENWPPVAVMGCPDCQFVDPDTGLATAKFVGDRSYPVAPGATLTTYAWTFPGGTPASSASAGTEAAPVSVTWDTPGTYWISLTVTDSNGKTHTGRRPIFIFPRTGAGAPYTQFKLASRNAGLDQHGHTTQFEVFGDADQAEFPDRALVVYFAEDWYGDTKKSIGGNFPYRSHIKFCGYIQKESTSKDPQTGVVTFDAATINALMATREGFSCWITTVGDATTWTEATNLTADRAALSLCRHQSSVLDICDVIVSGSALKIKSQEFAAKTSLLQQLQSLYDDLFAHVACDKQGRLYFELDPQMLSQADRAAIATVAALGHGDWRFKIDLPRPQEPRTSFINLGGVAYSGYPAEVDAILSKAPGDAPIYGGTPRDINGLILASQADGNEKAGLVLAYDNVDYPEIALPMAGNWDAFDVVPQEYVTFSLAEEDTKRGIVWTDQKLIPRRVELRFEESETGKAAMITIYVEKESYGPAGVDGDYPDEVPAVDPNITRPVPSPSPTPGGVDGDGNLLYMVCGITGRVFRTRNARHPVAASVIYENLGVVNAGGLWYITLDSWNCKNGAMVCGPNGIWRTTDLDAAIPSWTQVLSVGTITQIVSSICQKGLWMAARMWSTPPVDASVRVYWSTDGGDPGTWSSLLLADEVNDVTPRVRIECSSHTAQRAWVTWMSGNGAPRLARTNNQWSTRSTFDLPTTSWKWPANPHHRYFENAADQVGMWLGGNNVRFCSADYATCSSANLSAGDTPEAWQIGSYTWGTNRYWALTYGIVGGWVFRFHVSDDGENWTLQYTFPGTTRAISGWPYIKERFYAAQDGTTAPLLISDDRGENWQAQTGNWNALCTSLGINPDIYALVPVWIE